MGLPGHLRFGHGRRPGASGFQVEVGRSRAGKPLAEHVLLSVADALVLLCDPAGPTCHTNETSCFYKRVGFDGTVTLSGDGVATE